MTTALLCGRGAALGLTVQPLVMALLDGSPALPASAMPDANTLFNMAERLSGSFGIALLATLYASRAAATGYPPPHCTTAPSCSPWPRLWERWPPRVNMECPPTMPGLPTEAVMDAVTTVPPPVNEPIRQYPPGSADRAALEGKVKELTGERAELTMTIGGRERFGGGQPIDVVAPHNYRHVLGTMHNATEQDVADAIDAAAAAAPGWRAMSFDDRAAILLRAADLLSGPWRATINATTIAGQSKSVYQAEIDAACELIDFWRFNVHFARRLLEEQPLSGPGTWNRMEYRPLEGFVLAITPFNFTSIAANLPTAPALLGNVVVWKPSPTQQLAAHATMRLLEAAGLPRG